MCAAAVLRLEQECANAAVQIAPEVLKAIRDRVLDGYAAAPHGGVELGFVLLGRKIGDMLRLEAFREIPCSHLLGPRFLLSAEEEVLFPAWMATLARDPALADLEPIGWCCSHHRSGLSLLEREVFFHQRFFPKQEDIVMLVKPRGMQAIEAGIFLRNDSGVLDAEQPSIQLRSTILDFSPANLSTDPKQPTPETAVTKASAVEEIQYPEANHKMIGFIGRSRSRFLLASGVIGALVLLAVLVGGVWPATASLSVAMHPQGGNLVFTWKGNLNHVQSADIEIFDGTTTSHYDLTREFQRSGMAVFPHQTGNVQAVLTVQTASGRITRSAAYADGKAGRVQTGQTQSELESAASRLDATNRRLAALVSVLQAKQDHPRK